MAKKTEIQKFNILNHELVPFHELVSDDEKNKVLSEFNITPEQLPKIMDNDPVSLTIGAKPGQIVKITRKSHTAKEAIAYRLVIESND